MARTRRRLLFHRSVSVDYQKQITFIRFIFIVLFITLACKLFSLQIQQYSDFAKQAQAMHNTTAVVAPVRGLIYCRDKNGALHPLAINKKYYTVYAVPKEINNHQELSERLSQLISLPSDEIYSSLNKLDDSYEILIKKTDNEALISSIKEAKLPGVYISQNNYRYYPSADLASQVVGFIAEGADNQIKGRYGLELYYDAVLSGESGVFKGIRDALGRLVRSVFSQEKQVRQGADIITTLDKNVQFSSEQILANLITKRQASGGSIIVMEAQSGKIIALANYPTFNLNDFNKIKDYSIYRNSCVEDRYELGSVVKSFTIAAGLATGAITPETTYVDKGYYNIGGYRLTNYGNKVYGKVNMTEVLQWSINTGAIFAAEKTGLENLRRYFKYFGFNERTGIDLPNEVAGDVSNLEYPKANPTYLATASYGMGIAITPIELVKAYAVIANKGLLVTPYLVENIKDKSGIHSNVTASEPIQIIPQKTAENLVSMLTTAIENGYGRNAKIKNYSMAGKTGTAFIPLSGKQGYSEDMIHAFVGFFPASNPKFVILVKMDRPRSLGADAASRTVTLAFREIQQFLINYYNIPPDENIDKQIDKQTDR